MTNDQTPQKSRRTDAILALETGGTAESHSRSFARLLYERFGAVASERDHSAALSIEAVLSEEKPDLDSWIINLDTADHTGRYLVQAMRTPTAPRIDGGRRLGWHLTLILRMIRYLILLPSMEYRRKPGFLADARTFLSSIVSGLFLILMMPVLYVLALVLAVVELRFFRYMGTLLITATVLGVIAFLVYLGVGEVAFVEAVKGLQRFSADVTSQLDEPTIPESSLFQVLAAGATSLFIGLVYTAISILKKVMGSFVNLEADESDRSDLTRLLSPTHGAEFTAVLADRLKLIERTHEPSRIFLLSHGTNVILTYRSLVEICGNSIQTPVTLISWNATMTEGVTYGMDKLWMILPQHDWKRFQVKMTRGMTWVHLGATWNVLDNFKSAFKGPDGSPLATFAPQPISSAKALFFANGSTAADVLANTALDEAYRQEVRSAAYR